MPTTFKIHTLKPKSGQKFHRFQTCLYSNQIEHLGQQAMEESRCAFVAVGAGRLPGVYSRDQLMAVRFLSTRWVETFKEKFINPESFEELFLQELLQLKKAKASIIGHADEAVRWVHGDADGIPGIVIDDYGSVVVIQCGSQFGEFLLPFILPALLKATEQPVFERSSGQIRALEKLPERTRWIREPVDSKERAQLEMVTTTLSGLKLSFRPQRCQKTGLFIDQRENLELFKKLTRSFQSRSMLDLCSYVGAWSCAGAASGIADFTLVDQDKDALEMAQHNVAANIANGVLHRVQTHHGDLFEILSRLGKDKPRFDAVVADPPAFTKSAKHIPEASRAYQRLTKLASRLVSENGIYVACSCSRHIDEEEFFKIVSESLDADDWVYMGRGRQSPDHSVLANDKQSLYLKALFFVRRGSLALISSRDAIQRGVEN
jgi:23S rRNA (cytosine1962-C5)-methyltransferase